MKRSELKRRLAKMFSTPLVETSEQKAERVLLLIESVGMLPPRCELQTLGIYDNAWEAENEDETDD